MLSTLLFSKVFIIYLLSDARSCLLRQVIVAVNALLKN